MVLFYREVILLLHALYVTYSHGIKNPKMLGSNFLRNDETANKITVCMA